MFSSSVRAPGLSCRARRVGLFLVVLQGGAVGCSLPAPGLSCRGRGARASGSLGRLRLGFRAFLWVTILLPLPLALLPVNGYIIVKVEGCRVAFPAWLGLFLSGVCHGWFRSSFRLFGLPSRLSVCRFGFRPSFVLPVAFRLRGLRGFSLFRSGRFFRPLRFRSSPGRLPRVRGPVCRRSFLGVRSGLGRFRSRSRSGWLSRLGLRVSSRRACRLRGRRVGGLVFLFPPGASAPGLLRGCLMFTLAVVGSRQLPPSYFPLVFSVVKGAVDRGHEVLSGGALGADLFALRSLVELGSFACAGSRLFLPGSVDLLPAFYRGLVSRFVRLGGAVVPGSASSGCGRDLFVKALFARSLALVRASGSVVAFPWDDSSGTWFTCRAAARLGRPVIVFPAPGLPLPSLGCGRWASVPGWVGAVSWAFSAPAGSRCRHGLRVEHCAA